MIRFASEKALHLAVSFCKDSHAKGTRKKWETLNPTASSEKLTLEENIKGIHKGVFTFGYAFTSFKHVR